MDRTSAQLSIEAATSESRAEAVKKHGETFNSRFEAWAVIRDRYAKAFGKFDAVQTLLTQAWNEAQDHKSDAETLSHLEARATEAALYLCQVAACCRKARGA